MDVKSGTFDNNYLMYRVCDIWKEDNGEENKEILAL